MQNGEDSGGSFVVVASPGLFQSVVEVFAAVAFAVRFEVFAFGSSFFEMFIECSDRKMEGMTNATPSGGPF